MSFRGLSFALPFLSVAKRHHHVRSLSAQDHFGSFSQSWWDIDGPVSTLHDYNYVRVPFIAKSYAILRGDYSPPEQGRFERESKFPKFDIFRHAEEREKIHLEATLKGVRILDVGCGGGILSEALAKSGAHVVGTDPSEELISIAEKHRKEDFSTFSKRFGLRDDYSRNLEYIVTAVEDYPASGKAGTFDIVVASEVLEHIDNDKKASFVEILCKFVRPGGLLVITTPGRTLKSCLTNIVIAESVLKLVPRNSHQYDLFISPDALTKILEGFSFSEVHRQGLFYLPFARRFIHMPHCDYLYMAAFKNEGYRNDG